MADWREGKASATLLADPTSNTLVLLRHFIYFLFLSVHGATFPRETTDRKMEEKKEERKELLALLAG